MLSASGPVLSVQGSECMVYCVAIRVQGAGLRIPGESAASEV